MVDITNSQLLEKIIEELKQIKEESKINKEELKQQIGEESQKVLERLDQNTRKINTLDTKRNELENRCKILEKLHKKNNILIFGIDVPKDANLLKFTLKKLYELICIEIQESDINNIYQLGNGKLSPIKIEFVTYLKKELVFKNTHKLKGKKVFIAHDLTREEREDQKLLSRHLKAAREKNYFAKIKAKELHVNGEVYTLAQLRQVESEQEKQDQNNDIEFHNFSNSAPATPCDQESHFLFEQRNFQPQNIKPVSEQLQENKTSISEKRTNTSPADPKEKKKRKSFK